MKKIQIFCVDDVHQDHEENKSNTDTCTAGTPRNTSLKVTTYVQDPLKEYLLNDSEESQRSEAVNLSQISEASVSNTTKLEALNKYLHLSGVSPIKELQSTLNESSVRTQNRYINKAKQCIELLMNTICPGEEEFLRKKVLFNQGKDDEVVMETLVEFYNNSHSWTFQRQILSLIAKDMDFQSIKRLLPDITRFKFKQAQEHISNFGAGEPVNKEKMSREKYSTHQLDHFIDFITSGQIIKDQPFGEKSLKMDTGEVIKIPTVIRCIAPSTIITQYIALRREENIQPLGNSTLYKIMDECSASVRRSIEGLDNFVMEACRAFDELDQIIDKLELPPEQSKQLKEDLKNAKNYLKTGFKSHISRESTIEDHCLHYALSATEACFAEECNHQHASSCHECETLEAFLVKITNEASMHKWKNQEATMYMVEEAVMAIKRWKAHIVRSRNQDLARTRLVEDMSEAEVIITCDWAMKFLPRKYREGQVDWFAKRGINWHISVSLVKEGTHFSSLTHVHICENPTSQDASITSQIMVDVANDLLTSRPGLQKIHFFSDNAGCYKSSITIMKIREELREKVWSYNFCEAQNGKGPCDRRASHIKSVIKKYVNQGNDVTSATHMKTAVDLQKKKDIKVRVITTVNILDAPTPTKCIIPGISKLYNFQYMDTSLKMWKSFAVGEGKIMPYDEIGLSSSNIHLKTLSDWNTMDFPFEESTSETESAIKTCIFDCPIENCSRQFVSQRAVDVHILTGDCNFDSRGHLNVTERAKYIYAHKIMDMYPKEGNQNMDAPEETECTQKHHLKVGWALKESKSRVTFSMRQKEYMLEKFNIGKATGNKVDPFIAAEEMRTSGNFTRNEYLSGQQISSYFSRLFQQDKKSNEGDFVAASREKRIDHLKTEIKSILC